MRNGHYLWCPSRVKRPKDRENGPLERSGAILMRSDYDAYLRDFRRGEATLGGQSIFANGFPKLQAGSTMGFRGSNPTVPIGRGKTVPRSERSHISAEPSGDRRLP